jgi:GrpB-like predicted nucleotidyltransferase (UPF0157 family)
MPLTSPIQPHDPAWPRKYQDEVARLRPVFGLDLVEIHHVGSTAVPGLAAKPEIDLLAVVNAPDDSDEWTRSLQHLGYRRGGDLSPGHHFFKRDLNEVRTHKLHVCRVGHPAIAEMLRFRDHLRNHLDDRMEYEQLKLRLEKQNTKGIGEYLDAKMPFIQSILRAAD